MLGTDYDIYEYLLRNYSHAISNNSFLIDSLTTKFNNLLQKKLKIYYNFIILVVKLYSSYAYADKKYETSLKECILNYIKMNEYFDINNGVNTICYESTSNDDGFYHDETTDKYSENICTILKMFDNNNFYVYNIDFIDNLFLNLFNMNHSDDNSYLIFKNDIVSFGKSINNNTHKILSTMLSNCENYKLFQKSISYMMISQKIELNKLDVDITKYINKYNIQIFYDLGHILTRQDYINIMPYLCKNNKIEFLDPKYTSHFSEIDIFYVLVQSRTIEYTNLSFNDDIVHKWYLLLKQILTKSKSKNKTKIIVEFNDEIIDILLNYNMQTLQYLMTNIDKMNTKLSIKILKSINKFMHDKINCDCIIKHLETLN